MIQFLIIRERKNPSIGYITIIVLPFNRLTITNIYFLANGYRVFIHFVGYNQFPPNSFVHKMKIRILNKHNTHLYEYQEAKADTTVQSD